jgi:hypothetical protein
MVPGNVWTIWLDSFSHMSPPGSYCDDAFYEDELAVTDQRIITASGLGSIEFAREVIRCLKLYSDADAELWFDMFKRGVIPAGMV